MNCESLKELINDCKKETEWVEFKRNNENPNMVGEYISALANSATLHDKQKAYLIYGIDDNTLDLIGTEFKPKITKKGNEELENWLHHKLTPSIDFVIYEIKCDGVDISVFEIDSAKHRPISFDKTEYIRVGSYKKKLHEYPEKERKLWSKLSSQDSEDWSIKICEDATLEDLSSEAIETARELYIRKNPKFAQEVPTWCDETFLNKAKLTIKGKITNTAILLLGKPESEHFLTPAIAKITWILKDKDNISKDYEHFSCPFVLSANEVYAKIRNLRYRYIKNDTLFPDEVDSYDPYLIREALNNCIAHQDYSLGGKINVVEFEDRKLVFSNMGSFIPQSVESVLKADAPEEKYRNRFLADAMINLNMIDTIGSGIKKMFSIQKSKYFPLPEYTLENESVEVMIEGKVLDINYATKLATIPELSLEEIILLDKVQKAKSITAPEAALLKKKKLIEGKRPNLHISSNVAKHTNQKDEYIKMRGMDDEHYQALILKYLTKFGKGKRADFEKLLLDKLPDILDETQKKNKVKNTLQKLKNDGKIELIGYDWILSKKKKV